MKEKYLRSKLIKISLLDIYENLSQNCRYKYIFLLFHLKNNHKMLYKYKHCNIDMRVTNMVIKIISL